MTTYSPTQDGSTDGGFPAFWVEVEPIRPYGILTQPAGIAFTLSTGFTYSGSVLTISYGTVLNFVGGSTGTLTIYLANTDPGTWSTANLPTATGATQVGSLAIATGSSPAVFDVSSYVLARSQQGGWNGKLAFVLSGDPLLLYADVNSSRSATSSLRPVLTATATSTTVTPRPGPLNVWHVEPSARPRKRRT